MAKSNDKTHKKRIDNNCHIPDLVQAFSNYYYYYYYNFSIALNLKQYYSKRFTSHVKRNIHTDSDKNIKHEPTK